MVSWRLLIWRCSFFFQFENVEINCRGELEVLMVYMAVGVNEELQKF